MMVKKITYTSQGRTLEYSPRIEVEPATGDQQLVWSLPREATNIAVVGSSFATRDFTLPDNDELSLRVKSQETFLSGFYTALGMNNRAATARTIQIEVVDGK